MTWWVFEVPCARFERRRRRVRHGHVPHRLQRRRATVPDRRPLRSYNGTAPIEASSGPHVRHRLNPRGNRQERVRSHRHGQPRVGHDTPGRAYYLRKEPKVGSGRVCTVVVVMAEENPPVVVTWLAPGYSAAPLRSQLLTGPRLTTANGFAGRPKTAPTYPGDVRGLEHRLHVGSAHAEATSHRRCSASVSRVRSTRRSSSPMLRASP